MYFFLISGDKEKLVSSLQEAQNTISGITHENSILKGKLTALEIQFSAEKKSKETVCIFFYTHLL